MMTKTLKWLKQAYNSSKSLNKPIFRLFTAETKADKKHEFYRQIFILKNELNMTAGYPSQEPTLNLKDCKEGSYLEGQKLRISGENSIYVQNQTTKLLTMELELSEVFESWVEVYLMSLRYLENVEGPLDTLDKENIENLEKYLQDEFDGSSEKQSEMVLGELYEYLITKF